MTKEETARNYLMYLENGTMDKVIDLFTKDAIVVSPIYGTKPAKDFYRDLAIDTKSSKLKFDGLFIEQNSNRISLLFDYDWELKDGKTVQFKVVDIIEFDPSNKIQKLTIIYDTLHSRQAVNELKKM